MATRPQPHKSALRKGRRSLPRTCYFITRRAALRTTDVLVRGEAPWVVIEALRWQRDKGRLRLMGYCVTPNHLHFIMVLLRHWELGALMQSFGSFTGHEINRRLGRHGTVWDSGYYDHAIRDEAEFETRLAYLHDNPVRAELVEHAEDWPFSTAHPRLAPDIDWAWWRGIEGHGST